MVNEHKKLNPWNLQRTSEEAPKPHLRHDFGAYTVITTHLIYILSDCCEGSRLKILK
jgi:hypothetical protein